MSNVPRILGVSCWWAASLRYSSRVFFPSVSKVVPSGRLRLIIISASVMFLLSLVLLALGYLSPATIVDSQVGTMANPIRGHPFLQKTWLELMALRSLFRTLNFPLNDPMFTVALPGDRTCSLLGKNEFLAPFYQTRRSFLN
jgi:hypothetical protein